ncbi:MAG TPA: hypothetical protein VEP90_29015, partial [Methylomirabilota bacterium]|nr:hypothetical protein [Methylomirabilota bacterium]
SAGIQQHALPPRFSDQVLWELAGLALFGLLVGYWLGERLKLPVNSTTQLKPFGTSTTQPVPTGRFETVTITRLRAFLSYGKLKGKGIHLSDILLIGSRIDIDS